MKKIILYIITSILVLLIICVFIIGGKAGCYSWNIAVFILAPLAVTAFAAQIIALLICLIRRIKIRPLRFAYILITIMYALPITVLVGISPVTYPTKASSKYEVTMKMPVDNAVLFGGKQYKSHAMWPSECYAYDILKEPYDTTSSRLEDYGIFGENICSPVNGTVTGIKNDEADIQPNTDNFLSSYGNYIFIRIDETNTYLILAHLKQNSITVRASDKITAGQIIGQVGNSGTTSEPHLHIQHQLDDPLKIKFPVCAQGLPIIFEK